MGRHKSRRASELDEVQEVRLGDADRAPESVGREIAAGYPAPHRLDRNTQVLGGLPDGPKHWKTLSRLAHHSDPFGVSCGSSAAACLARSRARPMRDLWGPVVVSGVLDGVEPF
jgi:hypothetical protein